MKLDTNSLAHTNWNCKDHIHMPISIPPKYSISQIMGYLKGKSSLMIIEKVHKYEIQIWKSSFLVHRILCRYSRKK